MDIQKMIARHKNSHALATIAATKVDDPSAYVLLIMIETDIYYHLLKNLLWRNYSKYVNAGIYIFEPELLDEISSKNVVSIERDVSRNFWKTGIKWLFTRITAIGWILELYRIYAGAYWYIWKKMQTGWLWLPQ